MEACNSKLQGKERTKKLIKQQQDKKHNQE